MAIQTQIYAESLDWMDNGCMFNELSFNFFQKQQQLQQQQQFPFQLQNKKPYVSYENSMLLPQSTTTTATTASTISNNTSDATFISMTLSCIAAQSQEFDRYIALQHERFRLALLEQNKHQVYQLGLVLRKLDQRLAILLKNKDDEIAVATKKAIELEEFMGRMELENQAWQRLAAENEAMIESLKTTLEQLRQRESGEGGGVCVADGDAESCCMEGTGESEGDEGEDTTSLMGDCNKTMLCKICNSRESTLLFLPCRHLCSCQACGTFVHNCPVCRSVKRASIEALLS